MKATVPQDNSGSGLRKFRADGFLFDRVYSKRHTILIFVNHICFTFYLHFGGFG